MLGLISDAISPHLGARPILQYFPAFSLLLSSTLLTMATFLKKPLKLALVQLASGTELSYAAKNPR